MILLHQNGPMIFDPSVSKYIPLKSYVSVVDTTENISILTKILFEFYHDVWISRIKCLPNTIEKSFWMVMNNFFGPIFRCTLASVNESGLILKWDENFLFNLHVSFVRRVQHKFFITNIIGIKAKSGYRVFNYELATNGKKLDLLLANFAMIDKTVYCDIIEYVVFVDLIAFLVLSIEMCLRKFGFMWYLNFALL